MHYNSSRLTMNLYWLLFLQVLMSLKENHSVRERILSKRKEKKDQDPRVQSEVVILSQMPTIRESLLWDGPRIMLKSQTSNANKDAKF
ncbi:hypothetical protein DPMN_123310 [Dreissena polymorpha]|uniref:Uncharacterized protein n=1 Tax=Dreissena polymorpha TaxID=45954 RepID=A0A9D4GU71_DREPO|nr:hypothetical protein DPMN_123310 [Dreissena polymorpha]